MQKLTFKQADYNGDKKASHISTIDKHASSTNKLCRLITWLSTFQTVLCGTGKTPAVPIFLMTLGIAATVVPYV